MNPKERVQSIAIVTITVIALAVRIQSSPTPTVQTAVNQEESNQRGLEPAVSSGVFPSSFGARAQTLAAPGPNVEASGRKLYDEPEPDRNLDDEPTVLYWDPPLVSTPDPDVYVEIASEADLPWDLSDQQVVDQMLSLLSDEQRLAFREMWGGMEAQQRRDWIDQLRVAMSG